MLRLCRTSQLQPPRIFGWTAAIVEFLRRSLNQTRRIRLPSVIGGGVAAQTNTARALHHDDHAQQWGFGITASNVLWKCTWETRPMQRSTYTAGSLAGQSSHTSRGQPSRPPIALEHGSKSLVNEPQARETVPQRHSEAIQGVCSQWPWCFCCIL